MTVKIKPLGARIAVKALEAEEKTQGGIYIATKSEEKVTQGTVVALGSGVVDDKPVDFTVALGQVVVFNQYSATEVESGDEAYLVLKEDDVLAIIE